MDRRHINPEIEYLRAVAVLLVVLAHLPALYPGVNFYGQWTGVDLFFCISGYVISRTYEQSFDQSIRDGRWWAAAKAFWVRRIFRLTPSAWLWLSIIILCSWGFNQSGWFVSLDRALSTAFYFLTLTTNFALTREVLRPNGFFWSLTLEDQFYFLFPFFLLIVRGKWRYVALVALIAVQALPDRSLHPPAQPSLWWVTRLDALMWGIVIQRFSRSEIYRKLAPTFLRFKVLAFGVSAYLIFILIKAPVGYFYPWIGFRVESLVALASAGLVLLASYDRGYALPLPWPLGAAFKWTGERSYAIYLVHLPVFGICQEIWLRWLLTWGLTDPRYWYAIGFPVLTAVLADLNFRWMENPLRAYGTRLSKRILSEK